MDRLLKFPILVSELQEFLPHRPPMVWITQVNGADSNGGECLVQLDPEAHYMKSDQVRRTSVIEWIAQAYGYVSACQSLENIQGREDAEMTTAYLVSIHYLEIAEEFERLLQNAGSLLIQVKQLREVKPIRSVYGEVKTSTGDKIAAGELKVFSG